MALRNGKTSTTLQTNLAGSVHPPGSGINFWGSTAPQGWVLASGKTIGSLSSGATERANRDTFALFEVLWTSYDNTILPIQDSAGVASTRGASATADFNANKRLPTIDLRGRTAIGKDDMGGVAASRVTAGESGITGTLLGSAGGSQSHTLTQAQLAIHTHAQDAHSHGINGNVNYGVAINTIAFTVGGATNTLGTNGATATNQNTGSGSSHQNTQPSIVSNYILKL
jgi:microcystin-dependent protein